jgi:putative heme-binding domain-containing protein
MRLAIICGAIVLLSSAASAQEHGYTAADIESGGRLYQSSCAGCHGTTGDLVAGVDLARGQFRRGTSDAEIAAILRAGIPGTTMPPSAFSEAQSMTIVAYLRNMATAPRRGAATTAAPTRGDEARGKTLFTGKGECASCHRVNGVGPRVAPDLTEIGSMRSPADLQQKLLDPNANVRAGNRYVRIGTKDGGTISGRLLNQDTFSIQLIDTNERLVSVPKSSVREHTIMRTSPMPSYRDKLGAEEVADLVSYLVSLKGVRP